MDPAESNVTQLLLPGQLLLTCVRGHGTFVDRVCSVLDSLGITSVDLQMSSFSSSLKWLLEMNADCSVCRLQRPQKVKVQAKTTKGEDMMLTLDGWQARIFLHEYDHLQVCNIMFYVTR